MVPKFEQRLKCQWPAYTRLPLPFGVRQSPYMPLAIVSPTALGGASAEALYPIRFDHPTATGSS